MNDVNRNIVFVNCKLIVVGQIVYRTLYLKCVRIFYFTYFFLWFNLINFSLGIVTIIFIYDILLKNMINQDKYN